jgi:hypothetical protein
LNTSNLTFSGVTLNWAAVNGATSYSVRYKLSTSTIWTPVIPDPTVNSTTLSGLSANSNYNWEVVANCIAGPGSAAASTFTTLSNCGNPTGLTSTPTNNSALLSWTAVSGASSYKVEYKLSTSTSWTISQSATTSTSLTLSGLTANTAYNWRVTTNCGVNGISNPVSANFTTSPNCGSPSTLTSTAVTTTSVTLGWSAVTGASGYNVQYKASTTTSWKTVSATTNSINLTGLTASTTYNWQVQTKCSAGTGLYIASSFYTRSATCSSIEDNPTNNSFNASPATIPLSTPIYGVISTTTDTDVYKFPIATGGTVTLTLTVPADYNLYLLNSSGVNIDSSKNVGTTAMETISKSLIAGTYYARIHPNNKSNSTSCYTLTVTPSGGASRISTDVTGTYNNLFSSNDINQTKLVAYPNPVKDILNINMHDAGNEILIFNSRGEQVMRSKAVGTKSELNVSRFASGLYLVKIMKEGRLISQLKVIKQ